MAKRKLRIALIFGGTSQEREVSLRSAKSIAKNLSTKKYEIFPVEIDLNGKWLISSSTIHQIGKEVKTQKATTRELAPVDVHDQGKIDVALLALHGPGGEDGTIQGMLELLKIPYTCSGVLASALAMDKARTKRLVAAAGVPVPPDVVIKKNDYDPRSPLPLVRGRLRGGRGKFVIKPNKMGSSLGITIVSGNGSTIGRAIERAFKFDDEILVEAHIEGREITVPVLGNDQAEALPTIEILPWKKSTFYDYAAKYEEGGSEHIIPAPLTKKQEREAQDYALAAHQTLGCRGVTRSDFILGENGQFYFLEINTIPGMTPTSLVPQSAQAAGISFTKFLDRLIKLARER
ncbi:MAG: D-alanine--D-alanine ligase [Candidatus Doudnabacteria bacterium]|nr:D-alanine--D-alanine ligase [Candidatus Doudnabacteria bacterium]